MSEGQRAAEDRQGLDDRRVPAVPRAPSCGVTERLVLRGGVDVEGTALDVAIDPALGVLSAVGVVAELPGDHVERVDGMVVTPAPAEPHAHLDKVFMALGAPGTHYEAGADLAGAIAAMRQVDARRSVDDLLARAVRGIETLVAHGVTALRTHVDVRHPFGVDNVRVLAEIRQWATSTGMLDMQIVALVDTPLTGSSGRENRRNLHLAIAAGADVVGGCPYRDPDPRQATAWLLQRAVAAGTAVDLHTDETLDPSVLSVADLVELASEHEPAGGITASHCVSLGVQEPAVQHQLAAALAAAKISVVTLPQTNLFLQGRRRRSAIPRGLTALGALGEAGVTVAGGSDNTQDPFCSVGRLDPCETASLLVMAGHLGVHQAWQACTTAARSVMGLPPVELRPGSPAELLAIDGVNLLDAMSSASERRLTIHRGHIVARTDVSRHMSHHFDATRGTS